MKFRTEMVLLCITVVLLVVAVSYALFTIGMLLPLHIPAQVRIVWTGAIISAVYPLIVTWIFLSVRQSGIIEGAQKIYTVHHLDTARVYRVIWENTERKYTVLERTDGIIETYDLLSTARLPLQTGKFYRVVRLESPPRTVLQALE